VKSRNVKHQPFCGGICLLRSSPDAHAMLCRGWGQVGRRSSESTKGRHQKDGDPSAESLVLHLGSAQWVSRHSALAGERSGLTTFGPCGWVRWSVRHVGKPDARVRSPVCHAGAGVIPLVSVDCRHLVQLTAALLLTKARRLRHLGEQEPSPWASLRCFSTSQELS